METIPLPLFLPPSICTCKLPAFSCNMEITQMVIIQRKTFAFCKKASSLGKLWLDFCMAFLSSVTCWQRKLKRVSPFPGKQSRDQLLGLGGPGACGSYPAVVGKGKGWRSWGHRHILIFLVLFHCFCFCTVQSDYVRKNRWHFCNQANNLLWGNCFSFLAPPFYFFVLL